MVRARLALRSIRFFSLVSLWVLLWAPSAHAQRPPEKELVKPSWVHPLQGPGTAQIVKTWQDCVHYYDVGKHSELLVHLDKLRQAQIDAGVANLTPVSKALVYMAGNLLDKSRGDADIAFNVSKYSQLLSPDVPDFYFARSNLLWNFDKSLVGDYVGEYLLGLSHSIAHLPSLNALLLGSAGILWATGLLVMVIFSVLLLIRHLSLFSHDFGHLLPRALSKFQLNIIGLILLFIPFLMDLGLVPLFALWWVALWAYQTRHERIVTVIMVLFVYLWPIMNTLFVNSLSFQGGPAETAYRCHTELCNESMLYEAEVFSRSESKGQGSMLLPVATAYYKAAANNPKDTVSLEKAFELHKQGMKSATGTFQEGFVTGLGNVFFLKGMRRCNRARGNLEAGIDDFQSANKYYDTVLSSNPSNWVALYNKGRVLRVLSDQAQASDLVSRAASISPHGVSRLEDQSKLEGESGCSEEFNGNREIVPPPLEIPLIWGELFIAPEEDSREGHLPFAHALLIGPLRAWMLALLATGVLLAVILLTFAIRWFKPARRCIKCHEISCTKCRPELAGTGQCNQCVYYKIRSSYVDPKETWLREKRIENGVRMRRKLEAFLTFVFPGSGHILRGRPVRGVIFMWVLGSAVGGVFLSSQLSAMAAAPMTPLAVGSVIATGLWSVVAFVVYFLALIDIYSWR